jgi:peptidyl-prolyl cis-trans isomerase SurA
MKNISKVGLFIFLGVWLISVQVRAADLCNRVVAFVNNDIITVYELNKKIEEFTGLIPEDLRRKNEEKYLQIREEILDYLIEEKLTQVKIQEMGIVVTEKQIEATIENRNKDAGLTRDDLLAELKKRGLTYEKYAANVKKELEWARLIENEIRSKIIIKEEKINQYYHDHRNEFSSDDKVYLADIFLSQENPESEEKAVKLKETLEEIQKKIAKGADFSELAKVYSQGPGAESGGELGSFKMSQLDPELQRLLEGMSEGEVGGPLVRPNGIQLIKLVKRERGKIKTIEEAHDAIYNILYQEEVKTRYTAWIKELRENSFTKIILE